MGQVVPQNICEPLRHTQCSVGWHESSEEQPLVSSTQEDFSGQRGWGSPGWQVRDSDDHICLGEVMLPLVGD